MASNEYAINALKTAGDGKGRRSRTEQGYALRTLAWHARWRGEFDKAMDYCLKAETFLSETDHPVTRASIYATLGSVHYMRNRMDLATCAIERGVWLLRNLADENTSSVQIDLLFVQAMVQHQSGERARAGMTLGRARELAREEDMPLVDGGTAIWLFQNSEFERAIHFGNAALTQSTKSENQVLLPNIHRILGACYASQKNGIEALAHFQDGFRLAEKYGDQTALCYLNLAQAQFELARGDTEKARDLLLIGVSIAKRQNLPLVRKQFALCLAKTFETLGQYKAAVDQHKLAWRLEKEGRIR
jgi:ATP/maltotriose-dependent transcriptional regulator MalT